MHVTLIAAQSIDGFITFHDKAGSDFTSRADKSHFAAALTQFDCRVMGSKTYHVTREMTRRAIDAGARITISTRNPQKYLSDSIEGRLTFTADKPAGILAQLASEGCGRCALLGGSTTHSLFLAAQCVNELWLTVEPRLFGAGTSLIAEPIDARLDLISHEQIGPGTLVIKYRFPKKAGP